MPTEIVKSGAQLAKREELHTSPVSVVEIAFRQWRVFLWSALAIFFLGMLYTFGTHKKYGSEMVLMVQNARGHQVVTAEPTSAAPPESDVTEEQLNSQVEVLQSKDVLDEVISPGWNKIPIQQRSLSEINQHEGSVAYLAKHLEILPTKKSHVISVRLKEQDPHIATDTLNRLLSAFMAKQRGLQRPTGTAKFFADEAAKYKNQWDAALTKLSEFQQQQAITSPTDKEAWLQQQLADAQMQLRSADAQIAETDKRIQSDRHALTRIPSRQNTTQRTLPDTGYMDQMNALLIQLQNQKTELLTKYRPDDRLVKQIEQQIATTQKALSEANTNSFKDTSTDVNPTWQAEDQSYNSNMAAIAGIRARRAGLAASIANLQSQLTATEGQTVAFNGLQHAVADAESNYQLYSQKRDAAQIADAMDEHELLNVAVVQYPTYSPTPVHPKPLMDTILAVLSAVFVGAFAVFLAENGRRTFASRYELEAASAFPVLASVPLREVTRGSSALSLGPPVNRVAVLTMPGKRTARMGRPSLATLFSAILSRLRGRPVESAFTGAINS